MSFILILNGHFNTISICNIPYALSIRTWQELEPQLHAIFGEADRGVNEGQHQEAANDGKVSFQEVVKNVPEVKDQPDHRAMFDYVDGDNDRYITFEEFKKFMYNEVCYKLLIL